MKVVKFTIPVARDNYLHVQEDKLPHFYRYLHRHNEIQLVWVKKGEGTLIAGNRMVPFKPGGIFLIGANQPHLFKSNPEYFEEKSRLQIHSLNIFFDPDVLFNDLLRFPEMSAIKRFIESSSHGLQIPEKNKKQIAEFILKIKKTAQGYRLAAFIEMLQYMAGIKQSIPLSTKSYSAPITDHEGLRINDIYQYTMDNYSEDISLEEIAAIVHLTPQSFCRYFKKHTLKTYTAFLNEVRINEACKKLIHNDFSNISGIAYQTGFNNVVTFNRVFKSIIGKSPREYFKEYKNKTSLEE